MIAALLALPAFTASGAAGGARWIDPARCSDCHTELVERWRRTPMWRALGPLREGELDGLLPVDDAPAGLRYRFAGNTLVESVPERPSAGRRVVPIAFAVGAGVLDRSLVLELDQRLWFAPLEVLSADGERPRRAALAPGHAMRPGQRFGVPITPECLACHTDDPPPPAWPLNAQPRGWTPRGISCGACHAGAAEHAAWREAELTGEELTGTDPLGAQADFTREERMSVCAACHLQGDARIELVPGRVGAGEPGGDLLETRAVFVAREPTADLGFVSQTERLVLSRCYLEDRTLRCETCHDPHRPLDDPGQRARTRAACTGCHPGGERPASRAAACALRDSAAKRGRDCAACHLRRSRVFDVADVEIHDHWIRVRPGPSSPPGPLRFAESPEADWRRFRWPGVPPPEHVDDGGLWMMAYAHGGRVGRALLRMNAPPGPTVAALPMYHHVRATLLERARRFEAAEAAYRRALELDPGLGEPRSNLGLLLGRLGRAEEGIGVLDELIRRHPLADGALRNRALLARGLGRFAEFERDLEQALRLHPTAELARALALHLRSRGETARADRWEAEARRLDPRPQRD